ncbi:MAG: hypothetical protein FWF03_04645, partial [Defluviitaleaceae bacterium]|nr:hypothetical protein [Defluviitaleaceae bacterium]
MKRKNAACYLMIFSLLFANAAQFGCGKDDKPAEPLEQSDVVFGSHTNGLISLAIDDYANVYATTLDVGISKYSREGMLLESYPDTEYIFGLRYSDGFLYGFYSSLVDNNYIYQLNLETLIVKTINVDFPIAVVHSFTVSGDYAYMVVIPTLMDFNYEHEAGMFASNNEKLYAVKLSSGETTEITNIENPIRLYADSKGTVYVYAYTGGQYQLLNYDIGKKKATRVANMDDVGPVVSFAYENDIFVFLTYRDVQAKRMEDSLIYTVGENFAAVYGNTFTYHKGNLVFVEQRMEKYEGVYLIDVEGCEDGPDHDLHDHGVLNPPYLYIRTMRLGSGFVSVAPIGVKDVNQHQPLSNADTVVVSITPLFRPFDTKLIYERSGINCVYSDQTNDTFEQISNFLLTVMAGDNNSDIFYLALEDAVSRAMRDNGGYVRLNESDVITGYLDRCFDWVGEAARAANGDVWMLPLLYQTEMLFYVPENMERF